MYFKLLIYLQIKTVCNSCGGTAPLKLRMRGKPNMGHECHYTPQGLIASVNKELKWLLDKGYIKESTSSWISPMVTIKKPDVSA